MSDAGNNAGAPVSLGEALPKRERGRPSARWFSAEELATWLGASLELVERSLTMERFRGALWPNAEPRGVGAAWLVPERDLMKVLGPGIPRPLWVKEFADLIGYSVPQVNVWIRAGVIPTVMIFGKRRVLESVLWDLPKHMPVSAKKCPVIQGRNAA